MNFIIAIMIISKDIDYNRLFHFSNWNICWSLFFLSYFEYNIRAEISGWSSFSSLNSQQQTPWLLLIEIVIIWYVNWLPCEFLRKIDTEMLIIYFKDAVIFLTSHELTYSVNRAPLLFCFCNFGHLVNVY